MYRSSFRNRVVSSRFTLPCVAAMATLLWVLPNPHSVSLWGGAGMAALLTYLVMELNNRFTLIRIRTRLASSTCAVLMLVCASLHDWALGAIVPVCAVLSYFFLFSAYQQPRSEGRVFHAFLFAGVASLAFPPMAVVALTYYVAMGVQLHCLSFRTFCAGIIGWILPYWFYTAWALWYNRLETAYTYLNNWFAVPTIDLTQLTTVQWVTFGTIAFLSLTACIHFYHTSYNDKIRTRMLFHILALQMGLAAASVVVFPREFDTGMCLFIVHSAYFIAHYYALAKGRFMNIWFNLSLALLVALGIYNAWMQ